MYPYTTLIPFTDIAIGDKKIIEVKDAAMQKELLLLEEQEVGQVLDTGCCEIVYQIMDV